MKGIRGEREGRVGEVEGSGRDGEVKGWLIVTQKKTRILK